MASRGLMSCDLLQVKASLVVLRRIAALCVVSLVSVRLMLPPSPDHWYHRGFSWLLGVQWVFVCLFCFLQIPPLRDGLGREIL